ncbi:hypothetical protein [Chelatococcus asaccharovorans]|uniref:Homeodomain-like domain-containing protein n=1 Tax=Chelatococcus asaccharovorans TaxID=28210 RepID=A0A2V3U636_9HYPH|nr:hypothetical protein [Chelatococcus asaccharovorans]MBS7704113.1 hypothetical protein [Chelatococcus asaccharovorans]PXW58283.1 hypothetical protein C7450_106465 [Chelatococcus asaccharovorans]
MAQIGRPPERVLTLSETEREELPRLSGSQSAPHSLVRRAQIVLASADGEASTSIAHRFGVSNPDIADIDALAEAIIATTPRAENEAPCGQSG